MSEERDLYRWKTQAATEDEKALLRATFGDPDDPEVKRHSKALAQVLRRAWRSGVLEPDQIEPIFDRIPVAAGADVKFPLDFFRPTDGWGEAERHKAFIIPKEGKIPEVAIEGEEIFVPTFKVGNAIDWNLDYARDARWDVVAKAIEVYTNGFVQRLNDEGWKVVLAASASHGSIVTDTGASAVGVFTKRLFTNMQTAIKRLEGGRGSRLTDIYMSPEAMADIRNFTGGGGSAQAVDDQSLRNLLTTSEDGTPQFYGIRLHDVPDFGNPGGSDPQDYQRILTDDLNTALPTDSVGARVEFIVGLDLENRDSFVMPVREDMQMFDDPTLHRWQRAGVYGWLEVGFASLDNRRALLAAI